MLKLAVAGKPISHSKSPELFKSSGLDLTYSKIETDSPEKLVNFLKNNNYDGCNLTSPLKETIIPFLDVMDEPSRWMSAVNTIKIEGGKLLGFNTDPIGITESLKGIQIDSKDILILGSGGASKSVIYAINNLHGHIYLSSRNAMKMKHLETLFKINTIPWNDLIKELPRFQVIISTIPSLNDLEFKMPLSSKQIILDANYKDGELADYPNRISGLTWLKSQAIKSLEIFSGIKADELSFGSKTESELIILN